MADFVPDSEEDQPARRSTPPFPSLRELSDAFRDYFPRAPPNDAIGWAVRRAQFARQHDSFQDEAREDVPPPCYEAYVRDKVPTHAAMMAYEAAAIGGEDLRPPPSYSYSTQATPQPWPATWPLFTGVTGTYSGSMRPLDFSTIKIPDSGLSVESTYIVDAVENRLKGFDPDQQDSLMYQYYLIGGGQPSTYWSIFLSHGNSVIFTWKPRSLSEKENFISASCSSNLL